MTKYKVGDKVIVRKDLIAGFRYGPHRLYFSDLMLECSGQVAEITQVRKHLDESVKDAEMVLFYKLSVDEYSCWWCDEMLRGITPNSMQNII